MKKLLFAILLTAVSVISANAGGNEAAGPETGGLRMHLAITPKPPAGDEKFSVEVALTNVTGEAIPLRLKRGFGGQTSNFAELLEASTSIESFPAIAPWLGQVQAEPDTPESKLEYLIKPGETIATKWEAGGRQLKNKVRNPLEVQNPVFSASGLYAVHATLGVEAGGKSVLLRSNEQMASFGDSQAAPKHTYGPLWNTDEKARTAMLGLGSIHKVTLGDQFRVLTGNIGITWLLTITDVLPDRSMGTLEPSQTNPLPVFPQAGNYAIYERTKKEMR